MKAEQGVDVRVLGVWLTVTLKLGEEEGLTGEGRGLCRAESC